MIKEKVSWTIAAIIYIAILYTLVRPGSKGTVIIGNIGSVLTDLVRGATGMTWNPNGNNGQGSWSAGSQT
jgi:hypothetical protein